MNKDAFRHAVYNAFFELRCVFKELRMVDQPTNKCERFENARVNSMCECTFTMIIEVLSITECSTKVEDPG